MSAIREAPDAPLDDARVTFLGAQIALDHATTTAEHLYDARLLQENLFLLAIREIKRMCDTLDDLIAAVAP